MAQSWVLKVNIHCEGCKKKVIKVLQKVQGVYTIDIDSDRSRVTVTGDVDGESLVRKLLKYGKHSELLTEKNQTTDNSSPSPAVAAADAETKVEGKAVEITAPLNGGDVEPSKLERSNSEKPTPAVVENEKGGKEDRSEENREANRQDEGGAVYDSGRVLPANQFIVENQPVYTMSYNAVHPSTSYAYYQAPPAEMASSYGYTVYPPPPTTTYAPEYYSQDYYSSESYYGSMEPQAPPEGSYDMFSEENPNACNLM